MSVTALPITIQGLRSLLAVSRNSDEERTGRIGQEWEIREYAEANDITIVDLVREHKVKRHTALMLRPLLVDAVRRVQAGEAQGLLFRNQERIGLHAEQLIDTVHQAGGVIVTCWEGILQPRAESEVQYIARLHETARIAEERYRTRLRADAGLRAKTLRGGYKGGGRLNRRYGYELVDDPIRPGQHDYQPIEHEQNIITQLIQADPTTGGQGWQNICNQLNAQNIPSPTGGPWKRNSALKIARNEHRIRHVQAGNIIPFVPAAPPTQRTPNHVRTADAEGTGLGGA